MRILADLHISPETVLYLNSLGHDAVRVNQVLESSASDSEIIEKAILDGRTIKLPKI